MAAGDNILLLNVVDLLKKALEYDRKNDDILYNLAYVLKEFNEKELASKYANMITRKDNLVLDLIKELRK